MWIKHKEIEDNGKTFTIWTGVDFKGNTVYTYTCNKGMSVYPVINLGFLSEKEAIQELKKY